MGRGRRGAGQEQPQPQPQAHAAGEVEAEGGGGTPALEVAPGGRARVFQGGTYLDLHRMLHITSGAQVLYIGARAPPPPPPPRPQARARTLGQVDELSPPASGQVDALIPGGRGCVCSDAVDGRVTWGGGGGTGDHIYSDVLLSKKTLGWRTMLVVPELETEIRILRQNTSIAQVPPPPPGAPKLPHPCPLSAFLP